MEQDTEFSHIDTAISSLAPQTSAVSSENELPGSLPVPLLADFGHFEKQNDAEFILVESNDENEHDGKVSSNSNGETFGSSETCEDAAHGKNETDTTSLNLQRSDETDRNRDDMTIEYTPH